MRDWNLEKSELKFNFKPHCVYLHIVSLDVQIHQLLYALYFIACMGYIVVHLAIS